MTDGPERIRMVVFDWAGTLVDFGCQAPVRVVREVFARREAPVTIEEARAPMGKAKRDHLLAVIEAPRVRAAWTARFGAEPTGADVDALYADFLPLQREVLADHVDPIAGAAETLAELAARGIRVGSSTGYTRALMDVVEAIARTHGIAPETVLTADDVPCGRPAPWMIFECAKRLGVYPARRWAKVDDTPVGIEAGLNAGCWTVAVVATGNELGLTAREFAALSQGDREERLEPLREAFRDLGAHYVVDSVADVPSIVDQIDDRLAAGERP